MLDNLLHIPIVNYSLLVAGPVGLWLAKTTLKRQLAQAQSLQRIHIALFFIGFLASLAATGAVFDPVLNSSAIQACVFKTGGLLLTFVMLATCSAIFTKFEVERALVAFACIEFAIMIFAYFVLGVDLNPNAVGVRIATAGLVLFAILPKATTRTAAWVVSLVVPFILQCRTSTVASISAVAAGALETRTRPARGSILVLATLAILILTVFRGDIVSFMQQTARANLGSQNPAAKFFLSDKNVRKINTDYFDRQSAWRAALQKVEDRPLIGYGIGAESALFGGRSHNAYLSLLLEGGIGYFLAWMFVYGLFVSQLCQQPWITRLANEPIGKTQVLLFVYLVLAAIMESSGIGSISTPNNVIFLFLLLWVSQRLTYQPQQRSRSRVGHSRHLGNRDER